jgi:hypothetical protein
MPLWHQPAGATIFCENDHARVTATRHKDDTVKMRYIDGKTEVKELEHDDTATGPVMKWPNGERAKRCGIHPASPLDTRAILQLGEYKVELKRIGPESMRVYVPNVDAIEVGYPLREQDREAIKKLGVPAELVNLLP